ncbi:response regulator [Paenibacillus sp. J5C_2022]|uniref:response regulator n=1 Tax=Paenibacillus sp. J5C2022 TaxID=2977129 RepID=UPI0021D25EE0|nr:response regulator [Paenibacillus sp. J5C2022]MCU6712277.1 response regulator [Paenibacillus sp. J5C2022]
MHRIMIVDDESLLVNSLKNVIEMSGLAISDVICAYSGEEALDMLQSYKIDIVLSDIRMPEMDGIELIRHIQQRWPECKAIFLTGFSQFEYAQKAVQYGAFDYLLKPVSDGELLACIERAIKQKERETEQLLMLETLKKQYEEGISLLRQKYLRKLLTGRRAMEGLEQEKRKMDKLQLAFKLDETVIMLIVRIDEANGKSGFDEELQQYAISNIVGESLGKSFLHFSLEDDNDYIVFLVQPRGFISSEAALGKSLESIAESIQESLLYYLKVKATLLISDPVPSAIQWAEAYRTAVSLLRHSFYVGTGLILNFRSFDAYTDQSLQSLHLFPTLETLMESGREEEYCRRVRILFDEVRAKTDVSPGSVIELFSYLAGAAIRMINKFKLHSEQLKELDMNKLANMEAYPSLDEMERHFISVGQCLFALMNQSGKDHVDALIATVKLHIEHHLEEELSLTALAELVHVSPPYLSKLFKQHTGEGINKYVTNVRINRSKELMRDPHMKIYEVAAKVGYDNIPYFTKVFKKVVGVTPQEFKS